MTTIPQQQTIVQYVTSVSQLTYTFAFDALSADRNLVNSANNINVYYQAPNATPVPSSDLLVLNSDYTVTFNVDPTTGGIITLLFTPASGYYLTISLSLQATLTTTFGNAQTFNGNNLDNVLDYLLMLIQQLNNFQLNRALNYTINSYLPNQNPNQPQPATQLPTLAQNQIWVGSGVNNGIVAGTVSQVPSASVLQSLLAANGVGVDGARLIGYYDANTATATTVQAILSTLQSNSIPSGSMIDFGGTVAPAGYLLCDGAAVSRTTYAALFTAIGTTWGIGDGTTTFNVPDMTRRVSVGSGGSATSPAFTGTTVGSTGGEEVHTMTVPELVPHQHGIEISATATPGVTYQRVSNQDQLVTPTGQKFTDNGLGTATPFNVMQKGAVVLKIIKI